MVSIDVDALKDEKEDLREFLEKKLGAKVKIEEKTMSVDSETALSRGEVKDNVERFFHRKGLSDSYKAISVKEGLKIIKRRT